jgi:hypothetical protein
MSTAGKSPHEIGTRVRLRNITDPDDVDLNGREGKLWHPFRGFPIQDVGVVLDQLAGEPRPIPVGVYLREIEVIKQ